MMLRLSSVRRTQKMSGLILLALASLWLTPSLASVGQGPHTSSPTKLQVFMLGQRTDGKSVFGSLLRDMAQVIPYERALGFVPAGVLAQRRGVVFHGQYWSDLQAYEREILNQTLGLDAELNDREDGKKLMRLFNLCPYLPLKPISLSDAERGEFDGACAWLGFQNITHEETGEGRDGGTEHSFRFESRAPEVNQPQGKNFQLKIVDVPGFGRRVLHGQGQREAVAENIGECIMDPQGLPGRSNPSAYDGIILVVRGDEITESGRLSEILRRFYAENPATPQRVFLAVTRFRDYLGTKGDEIRAQLVENGHGDIGLERFLQPIQEGDRLHLDLELIKGNIASEINRAMSREGFRFMIPRDNVFLFENESYLIPSSMGEKIQSILGSIAMSELQPSEEPESFREVFDFLAARRQSLKLSQFEAVKLLRRLVIQQKLDRRANVRATAVEILSAAAAQNPVI